MTGIDRALDITSSALFNFKSFLAGPTESQLNEAPHNAPSYETISFEEAFKDCQGYIIYDVLVFMLIIRDCRLSPLNTLFS